MKEYEHKIYEALGEASMQWNPRPSTQVFDSKGASDVGKRLIDSLLEQPELAIDILRAQMEKDKSEGSYYYAWQANIAMAFKDNVDWKARINTTNGVDEYVLTFQELYEIANSAAKNFLDMLIKPKEGVDKPNSNQPIENHEIGLYSESKNYSEIAEAWLKGEVSLDLLGHMLQQGELQLIEYLTIRWHEPIKKFPNQNE